MPTEAAEQSGKRPVDRQALSARLLGSAAKKSYDPVVDIDWAAPIPDDLYGLSPEWSTLYGTPLWDVVDRGPAGHADHPRVLLDLRRRHLVRVPAHAAGAQATSTATTRPSRTSVGADRDRRRVPALGDVRPDGGEVRCAVLPAAGRRSCGSARRSWPRFDGPAAYAAILVAEEILDIFQRDLMKDERVQPLTRATSQIHVVEEARHMRFAREEIARRTPELSRWQLRRHRTGGRRGRRDRRREPGAAGGLRLRGPGPERGQGGGAGQRRTTADKLRDASTGLVAFLRDVGLIGGASELLWKRARLI